MKWRKTYANHVHVHYSISGSLESCFERESRLRNSKKWLVLKKSEKLYCLSILTNLIGGIPNYEFLLTYIIEKHKDYNHELSFWGRVISGSEAITTLFRLKLELSRFCLRTLFKFLKWKNKIIFYLNLIQFLNFLPSLVDSVHNTYYSSDAIALALSFSASNFNWFSIQCLPSASKVSNTSWAASKDGWERFVK